MSNGAGLGEKMWNAAHNAFEQGRTQVMILGSDAPTLPPDYLKALLASQADIAFGPSIDGGYYAVQFRKLPPNLFDGVEWSTDQALDQSIKAAEKLGLCVELGLTWYDIDSPADLVRLKEAAGLLAFAEKADAPPTAALDLAYARHFLGDVPGATKAYERALDGNERLGEQALRGLRSLSRDDPKVFLKMIALNVQPRTKMSIVERTL